MEEMEIGSSDILDISSVLIIMYNILRKKSACPNDSGEAFDDSLT